MTVERHPLDPFLPPGATLLFLGSFPPPRARWSMDFFYPNFINDFWRVMGMIHYGDFRHFELPGKKAFDREAVVSFAASSGLAFFDAATCVRRLKDNASDAFLEVLEPTDVGALMAALPACHCIVTTGGKSGGELLGILERLGIQGIRQPAVGGCLELHAWDRDITWWRMPSTSRAFPMPLEQKAAYYRRLF